VKLLTDEDEQKYGDRFRKMGVEVIRETWPYREWLEWNKNGRWCVLTRGKHDCLSFKMLDYCSIGAAVLADYVPTTQWPVPVREGKNFLSLGVPAWVGDEQEHPDLEQMRQIYKQKARAALEMLNNEAQRLRIAQNNVDYFVANITNAQAARYVMSEADKMLVGELAR